MTSQHLTYEFSILLTAKQDEVFCQILRDNADIYNGTLQYIRDIWSASGSWEHFEDDPNHKRMWYHQGERLNRAENGYSLNRNSKALTELRNDPKYGPEWSKINRVIQKDALNRLDKAMKAFFRKCKKNEAKKGFPRFKPYKRYKSFSIGKQKNPQSYKLTYSKNKQWVFITFKGMPGKLRVFLHRPFPKDFEFKDTRIVKVSKNEWKIQFVTAIQVSDFDENLKYTAFDLGIKDFATCNDGKIIKNPRWFEESKKIIRRLNRSLSRKKLGSNNWKKICHRLAKAHQKIANQRKNFHHQEANKLVAKAKALGKGIAAEDLQVSNMIINRCLSAKIADVGWRSFLNILEYKALIAGISFKKINPRNTSQLCSQCGTFVSKKLHVRIHNCHNCGLSMDRDQNAAINIGKRAESVAESNLCERDRSLSQNLMGRTPQTGTTDLGTVLDYSRALPSNA